MGLKRGQTYNQWYDTLTLGDIHEILRAHYDNEMQHMQDIDADAEMQEVLDGSE